MTNKVYPTVWDAWAAACARTKAEDAKWNAVRATLARAQQARDKAQQAVLAAQKLERSAFEAWLTASLIENKCMIEALNYGQVGDGTKDKLPRKDLK